MKYKVALLPGDGIGPEIMRAAEKVMHAAAEKFEIEINTEEALIGGVSYDAYENPLTDETLALCLQSNAVLLGAVGGYKWESLEHHLKPEAALLKLRKSLSLWANVRPAKVYPQFTDASSIKEEVLKGTDFVVIRELTGGIYFGQPRGMNGERGWNTMEYSREEIERIVRVGFETARKRKKKLVSIDKANVLEVSQFWRNIAAEISKEYPDVELSNMYVDNAAMQIVRDPKQFDVVVTSNLFGDIISDIAGQITGSLGMLPSASLGSEHYLFEPVHGSAPDIAGQNKANPIAMIGSVAMMFTHAFNLPEAGRLIGLAIEATLSEGLRTIDIMSDGFKLVSTAEMGEKIKINLVKIAEEKLQKV